MTATPLLPCPTPDKVAYPTRGAALAGFSIGPQTGNHHPYRCRCGRFPRSDQGDHNTEPWCEEIMRITPQLGLPAVKAAPVKTRRIDGKVMRRALDGHLPQAALASWPHSIRPDGYYARDAERIRVRI